MINKYLEQQIKEYFHFEPTFEQERCISSISGFLFSQENSEIFLLKGFAGTGKTSLVGALVHAMDKLEQKVMLLAPTGRAAKVFSIYAEHPAFTIHKKIYRQRAFSNEMSNFSLADNLHQHTLFIVDEASMIANEGLSGALGSGRLLDDLIQYVYSGTGCRLMLLGDTAQLPPVGEELSPALDVNVLKGYGMKVRQEQLTQVVRQSAGSGILYNATSLRQMMEEENVFEFPRILTGFPDVHVVNGEDLIESLTDSYNKVGMDGTIVVTRSNKRANIYNRGIRNSILYREEELSGGDLLMIAKNNYFWTAGCKELEFIANGDIAVVRRVRRTREMYGFRFADVLLSFPDYNDLELDTTVLLDTLQSESPSLSKDDNNRLFNTILEDYSDIPLKHDRMKKMKADPYYNALQVKYAYAVTCHKAQGGQWSHVYLDQGYLTEEMLGPDYYRWLYTAFTRATEHVYLVNWPEKQIENPSSD